MVQLSIVLLLQTLLALSILSASAQSFSSPSSPLTLTKDTPVTVSSMPKGTAIYYSFPIPPNTRNLSITTTGTTGDVPAAEDAFERLPKTCK